MSTKNTNAFIAYPVAMIAFSVIFSGCAPSPASAPTMTDLPVTATVAIPPTNTAAPTSTKTATITPIPFPKLTLEPGDFYFSFAGQPGFIFSRNISGYEQTHYETFLDWTQAGGSRLVRLQLDSLGWGYTKSGGVDEAWAKKWEQIFDRAEADGLYILPVFSGWFDWNAGAGYSTWKSNPMNAANGGPVVTPAELFQKGSATQTMWMKWMQTLVRRWKDRKNFAAWEIFSEVNLATCPSESAGVDFVNTAAALIRETDPSGRPVTASLADIGTWPNFNKNTAIDFINIHPYQPSAQLDRAIISEVRQALARYGRPVLIGESGLSAETPDSNNGKLTVAENAARGIRHAIWAAIVSGAMNGRALYWEDSFGIYFPTLGIPWMQRYKTVELPAANFVSGVDYSGFQPLKSAYSAAVWGAAVGSGKMVIGWYRDAASEPPNWNLKPVISKQTVTITVPESATNWKIDFYDTKTGTKIISSASLVQIGSTVTITLPDFTDDIAFKMYSQL
jgi:hypothetical protein